jgi:hypothetical protein
MSSQTRWQVENWASGVVRALGAKNPPVDLFRVAALRRIQTLELRRMIPRGGLLAVDGGFQLYIRDPRGQVFQIEGDEPDQLLSARQRFTFAHEVAHTLFFDLSKRIPSPRAGSPDDLELENLCDDAAGHMLVPAELLKTFVPDDRELAIELVQQVATIFRVSLSVALNRVAHVTSLRSAPRCVLLARRQAGDAQIREFCFSAGMLEVLPRPMRFSKLGEWVPDVARNASIHRQDHWETVNGGRTVTFRKLELGDTDSFLIQAVAEL